MKKPMHREAGSSTLMVILIIFMLILFGVFALMSAYSEYKLSSKSANWTKDYYALDKKAVERVAANKKTAQTGKLYDEMITMPNNDKLKLHIQYKFENGTLRILSWKEVQNSFDIEETESLWDGN